MDETRKDPHTLTPAELAHARAVEEYAYLVRSHENEDRKEDLIRRCAVFALVGLLLFPVAIVAASAAGYSEAAQLLQATASVFVVSVGGLLSAFFASSAYTKTTAVKHAAKR